MSTPDQSPRTRSIFCPEASVKKICRILLCPNSYREASVNADDQGGSICRSAVRDANLTVGKNNRSKSACTEFTLKLFKIKQFGRLLLAYAVQSVHRHIQKELTPRGHHD
jgi:hypothetical protein